MPSLQIQLFGDFQLVYNNAPVTAVNQARLQSLLAYLILHRDAPQTRQRLAFLFWPESTDAQAHANLRQLLHRLQRALPTTGDFLHLDAKTVQWRPEAPFTLDIAEFERHLTQADEAVRKGDDAAARSALQSAVASYQGDLLLGCYDEWVLPDRERWQGAFLKALEQLIVLAERQRDYATAIAYAQRLLRHDPLHETTYGRLMRLHALAGDRASALRVYHTCATTLQRELGVEPNLQTRTVYEQLLNLEASPALPSTHDTEHGIQRVPASGTHTTHQGAQLIGRQAEWQTLLSTWRMVANGRAHLLVV
ncbi:MAG TPA: BTAD domain-containing putative transcriptional regulator, partial [Caldilineaceae bacterium]|nr:BTAD domain-containing putative transcriptional regulator [Caldilineaceae bacterium]